jgi:uncharacterized protein
MSRHLGKLKVFDIPEEGMDIEAHIPPLHPKRSEDEWFARIARDAFGDIFSEKHPASLSLHLLRTVDNVQVAGHVETSLTPVCGRCAEAFETTERIPLHVHLAPHKAMHFQDGEVDEELGENDVAFSFYKGETIDLPEILRELILLETPVRRLCSEDCKGLCPRCGQDLNTASCDCHKKTVDPRLEALKNIKLKPR